MEHFIFLIQMVSILLASASIILICQRYRLSREKSLSFFAAALFFILLRNAVFAIARYGAVTRFFVFSDRFVYSPAGGLVYCGLLYISHLLLMLGMNAFGKKSGSVPLFVLLAVPSVYSLFMLFLFALGVDPVPSFRFLGDITFLTVIPILTVKTSLLLNALRLVKRGGGMLPILFLLFLSSGQIFDGIFYAFDYYRVVTLILSFILPYSAFLILLPMTWRESSENTGDPDDPAFSRIARDCELSPEECDLIRAIVRGKSNKEIAFDMGTTLSIIKHRIFRLYRKCAVNSRWEMINLFMEKEP